ncbi:MAG TPA: kelch repeat-containing protein [Candidatus Xenobia bacterium]|nr:kelch repeat-containing protein [Candidatus Xenobia bacterium]
MQRMGTLAVLASLMLVGFPDQARAQGGTWTSKAPMPTARTDLGVVGVSNTIYAIGGTPTDGASLGTVEAYDPATDTWTTKAPMPTARNDLGVGVINGIIYAVGGCPGFCSITFDTLEAYDPVTNTWTSKASMPSAHTARAGVVGGKLYVVGGFTGSSLVGTVEEYDPSTDTWSTRASMPTPRGGFEVGEINGILYVVGGVASGSLVVGTLEAYDPATDTWTTKAPMPTPRYLPGASALGGKLYVLGGQTVAGVPGTVEVYDPTTDTWSTVASMPTARRGLGVGVVNGILYAVGGSVPVEGSVEHPRVATNEAFNPVKTVGIDIKPASDPNSINLGSAGTIPVAILSSGDFNAPAEVDPDSLRLAGAAVNLIGKSGRFQCGSQDVNGDGLPDLVCHFDTAEFFIELGESTAVLEGQTLSGRPIRGEDSVRIVPN